MKIIGLSGKIGTGKTTLANIVLAQVANAERVSFAAGVRDELHEHLGVPRDFLDTPEFKSTVYRTGERFRTGRELLQWWGTGVRRAADPDYWVRKLVNYIDIRCEAGLVIVDDVRMTNEAKAITDMGGLLVRLDPFDGWQPGPNAEHITETALDGYPFTARFAPAFGELDALAEWLVRTAEEAA